MKASSLLLITTIVLSAIPSPTKADTIEQQQLFYDGGISALQD
jgi:hypothetical protein